MQNFESVFLNFFPEAGSDEDSEPEMDEKDLDRQMGELDGKDAEKLDEQIWGSDEEEEEEEKKV